MNNLNLHSILIYPIILIFSSTLKGKKEIYKDFFIKDKKEFEKEEVLKILSKEYSFFDKIKDFFDRTSILYKKTFVTFDVDISKPAEENKFLLFNFSKILNVFYSMSILSKRTSNDNIILELTFEKMNPNSDEIDNFLRYALLSFGSRKVDKLYIDNKLLKNKEILLAYETMVSFLNNSTIKNFSHSKDLYVLTCIKDKKKFDVIWSSNREIELTDFNRVYDRFGKELKSDIKITKNPIYAYHK